MIRVSVALAHLAAIAVIASFAGSVFAQSTPATSDIPAKLAPPADSVLVFELNAKGVQIYTCQAKTDDPSSFVWTFKAPAAELLNQRGDVVGYHFAGPTWQGNDGSAVVGSAVERARAKEDRKAYARWESAHKIDEMKQAKFEKEAASAKGGNANTLTLLAQANAEALETERKPRITKLIADDVTAEKLASLLVEQRGFIAVMSSEGGAIFGNLGGRYSDKGSPRR